MSPRLIPAVLDQLVLISCERTKAVLVLCLLSGPQVNRTYCCGTYRAGPMRQISLVGAVDEEVGDYFPEFLDMLEESPFLRVSSNLWCVQSTVDIQAIVRFPSN